MLNIKWLFTVSIISMIIVCNMHAMDDVYQLQCAADYKEYVRLQTKHAQYQTKKEVCTPIKTLHGASKQDFEKVVDAMRAKNLTTCDCIKFLAKEKHEKALQFVQQEFGLTNEIIKTFKQQVKFDYKVLEQQGSIKFQFDDSIPFNIQTMINRRAQELNIRSSRLVTVKLLPKDTNIGWGNVSGIFYKQSLIPEFKLELEGKCFSKESLIDFVIAHELMHIQKNHAVQHMRLINLSGKYAPSLFIKAQEAEADRIPAACSDCKTAKNFLISLRDNFWLGDSDPNNDCHPKPKKRYQWAQTIHTLRTLEEKFKKSA